MSVVSPKHKNKQLVNERSVVLQQRCFASAKPVAQKKTVTLHFKKKDDKTTVKAKVGDNLLDVIIDNDVDVDGFGACEGTLACSTCHLIFTEENYEKINEKPTDEELDMLDLAFGLEDTSRLGCQVIVTEEMNGWEIVVPEGVSDAREPWCKTVVVSVMLEISITSNKDYVVRLFSKIVRLYGEVFSLNRLIFFC